jgi:hypothetical protein
MALRQPTGVALRMAGIDINLGSGADPGDAASKAAGDVAAKASDSEMLLAGPYFRYLCTVSNLYVCYV